MLILIFIEEKILLCRIIRPDLFNILKWLTANEGEPLPEEIEATADEATT